MRREEKCQRGLFIPLIYPSRGLPDHESVGRGKMRTKLSVVSNLVIPHFFADSPNSAHNLAEMTYFLNKIVLAASFAAFRCLF